MGNSASSKKTPTKHTHVVSKTPTPKKPVAASLEMSADPSTDSPHCVLAELVLPSVIHTETIDYLRVIARGVSTRGFLTEVAASIHPDSVMYGYYLSIYKCLLDRFNTRFPDVTSHSINPAVPIVIYIGEFFTENLNICRAICHSIDKILASEIIHPTNHRMRYMLLPEGHYVNTIVCAPGWIPKQSDGPTDIFFPIPFEPITPFYAKADKYMDYTPLSTTMYRFTEAPFNYGVTDESVESWAFGTSSEQMVANEWLVKKRADMRDSRKKITDILKVVHIDRSGQMRTPIHKHTQQREIEKLLGNPDITPCPIDDNRTLITSIPHSIHPNPRSSSHSRPPHSRLSFTTHIPLPHPSAPPPPSSAESHSLVSDDADEFPGDDPV